MRIVCTPRASRTGLPWLLSYSLMLLCFCPWPSPLLYLLIFLKSQNNSIISTTNATQILTSAYLSCFLIFRSIISSVLLLLQFGAVSLSCPYPRLAQGPSSNLTAECLLRSSVWIIWMSISKPFTLIMSNFTFPAIYMKRRGDTTEVCRFSYDSDGTIFRNVAMTPCTHFS
jgi:hypothetical protein